MIANEHEKIKDINSRFPFLAAAVEYAERGLPVVQCHPRNKIPIANEWQNKATTDKGVIKCLWSLCLDANVGIQMGVGATPIIDIEGDEERSPQDWIELWGGTHGRKFRHSRVGGVVGIIFSTGVRVSRPIPQSSMPGAWKCEQATAKGCRACFRLLCIRFNARSPHFLPVEPGAITG